MQDYTDRSMPPEPTKVNKSIRSEPANNKLQTNYYSQKGPSYVKAENREEVKKK